MATVSIQLRKDRINKDGEAPLNFFIIKDRKLTKVKTGIMVKVEQWDEEKGQVKRSHPNMKRLNAYLTTKKAELMDEVLEQETQNKSLTSRQLRDQIYGKTPTNFFAYAKTLCQAYLQNGQIGTYDKSNSILKKLEKFHGSENLVLEAPIKLTTSGRGKLTTCFAGEDLVVQVCQC